MKKVEKVEFAKLKIGGKTYELAYDFNIIAEAERIADCNLLAGISALLLHTMTASQVRGLLYAALRKAQPKMTIADAGGFCTIDNLPDIREALLKAYDASLPADKKILAAPIDVPEAGAGSADPLASSNDEPAAGSAAASGPVLLKDVPDGA